MMASEFKIETRYHNNVCKRDLFSTNGHHTVQRAKPKTKQLTNNNTNNNEIKHESSVCDQSTYFIMETHYTKRKMVVLVGNFSLHATAAAAAVTQLNNNARKANSLPSQMLLT
jgi:hypothetical protein